MEQETRSVVSETIDVARMSLAQLLFRVPLSQLGGFALAVGAAIAGAATLGHYFGQDKREAAIERLNNQHLNSSKEASENLLRLASDLSQCNASKLKSCAPAANASTSASSTPIDIQPDGTGGDSCAILTAGNTRYSASQFEQAIATYRSVERVDQFGKSPCTGPIYASIASSFTILADRAHTSDPEKSASLYRLASTYNRAFAHAVACNLGSCEGAAQHWRAVR